MFWSTCILGDLENSGQINIIILNTKKTIFLSKLDGVPPLPRVKQSYMHDEYKYTINNKEHIFEKMVFIKKILQYVIVAYTILKSHNFNVLQTLVCII